MRTLLLVLLAFLSGCAANNTDDTAWRYAYRLEGVPQSQGCTVARSLEPAVVELKWPAPASDGNGGFVGWYHPCPDNASELCPDLSAPGMFVDVYARGDVDAHDFVVTEACR